jgi:hypothetical protein
MRAALLLVLSLAFPTAFAGVENILSMQRDANGMFNVLCEGANGVTALNAGIEADKIRSNDVCGEVMTTAILEEGFYKSTGDFCDQTLKYDGENIVITLGTPCSGMITLMKFQDGWYRGKLEGYEYVYELEVKSETSYVFHSRSFASSGEFNKQSQDAKQAKAKKTKRGTDPAGI